MEKLLHCIHCEFSCEDKPILKRHMKTHLNQFFCCNICGYLCQIDSDLNTHRSMHSKRTLEKCRDSIFRTISIDMLTKRNYHHLFQIPIDCQYCNYKAYNTGSMSKHKNKIHPLEVQRELAVNNGINRNLRKRLYTCKFCRKSFYSPGALKNHITNDHLQLEETCTIKKRRKQSKSVYVDTSTDESMSGIEETPSIIDELFNSSDNASTSDENLTTDTPPESPATDEDSGNTVSKRSIENVPSPNISSSTAAPTKTITFLPVEGTKIRTINAANVVIGTGEITITPIDVLEIPISELKVVERSNLNEPDAEIRAQVTETIRYKPVAIISISKPSEVSVETLLRTIVSVCSSSTDIFDSKTNVSLEYVIAEPNADESSSFTSSESTKSNVTSNKENASKRVIVVSPAHEDATIIQNDDTTIEIILSDICIPSESFSSALPLSATSEPIEKIAQAFPPHKTALESTKTTSAPDSSTIVPNSESSTNVETSLPTIETALRNDYREFFASLQDLDLPCEMENCAFHSKNISNVQTNSATVQNLQTLECFETAVDEPIIYYQSIESEQNISTRIRPQNVIDFETPFPSEFSEITAIQTEDGRSAEVITSSITLYLENDESNKDQPSSIIFLPQIN